MDTHPPVSVRVVLDHGNVAIVSLPNGHIGTLTAVMETDRSRQTNDSEPGAPCALIIVNGSAPVPWLSQTVSQEGYRVREASTPAEARGTRPDVVLVPLDGSRTNGVLDELGNVSGGPVVIIGDHGAKHDALRRLRRRVAKYVSRPVDRDRLRAVLADLADGAPTSQDHPPSLSARQGLCDLVGVSRPMQRVYDMIERVAPTEASVIVTGESGTGKEVVARAIHASSSRQTGPFEAINCGAVSPQLFESELFGHERGSFTGADRRHKGCVERASGGTLFLDEIAEMPPELQVKLLRILETRLFTRVGGEKGIAMDARILAATNRDIGEAVADGTLREDLYYRLKVFQVYLPPLRDRPDDIEPLATYFAAALHRSGRSSRVPKRFDEAALTALRDYRWPGNVRELKNVVHSASIMTERDVIGVDALPDEVLHQEPRKEFDSTRLSFLIGLPLAEVERRLLLSTLAHHNGNKARTAKVLGISLKTLYSRLHRYEASSGDASVTSRRRTNRPSPLPSEGAERQGR